VWQIGELMANHQVYVIWTNPLFHDSLRQLLDHTDITWVGASSDFTVAIEEISHLQPDTILLEEVEGETTTSAFMKIVEQFQWDLRVIGVSLNDNQMSIFQHAQQTVGQTEDLIRLIVQ
jgi:DNA-binding NarL/FixJ family response regulator